MRTCKTCKYLEKSEKSECFANPPVVYINVELNEYIEHIRVQVNACDTACRFYAKHPKYER